MHLGETYYAGRQQSDYQETEILQIIDDISGILDQISEKESLIAQIDAEAAARREEARVLKEAELSEKIRIQREMNGRNSAATRCEKCGELIVTGSRFCASCGTEVQKLTTRFCPVCGVACEADDLFCMNCGESLPAVENVAPSVQETSDQQQEIASVETDAGTAEIKEENASLPTDHADSQEPYDL